MSAIPRGTPYIWITWLASVMTGDVRCHWQYWFQAHHKLKDREPSTFDSVGWQVSHTRLLTEIKQELFAQGTRPHTEVEVSFRVPNQDAKITGRIDCIVEDGSEVILYDCKTGRPRDSHQVQLMAYMYGLSTYPRYASARIRGTLVYKDHRVEVPHLRDDFASDLEFFVGVLSQENAPMREPGDDCEYCKITAFDCPDRQ